MIIYNLSYRCNSESSTKHIRHINLRTHRVDSAVPYVQRGSEVQSSFLNMTSN